MSQCCTFVPPNSISDRSPVRTVKIFQADAQAYTFSQMEATLRRRFYSRNIMNILQYQTMALVEVAMSPAKYAFFHILGYTFFRAAGYIEPTTTLLTAAKVGCTGGTMLAIPFLVVLIVMADHHQYEPESGTVGQQLFVMVEEMLCSAIAAVVGGFMLRGGGRHDLLISVVVGAAGPVISLVLMFSLLGMAIGGAWILKEFRQDWFNRLIRI
ncbi:hypothetical protein BDQ12DRAFT_667559 [Crucibulum laeve]|uniref:Uncharacterized protein n=1 Tax=Crucibulum laeve TaxID=68775 RepID=A0A5C3LXQ0_9AGAR|nr:hypothetical protein BDQ12DRAFT_667559 [Crucibulum laeve]